MLKPVIQEDETGCGFACIAVLADKSYNDVKLLANSIGIEATDKRLYSDTAHVRTLLKEYDIPSSDSEINFTGWDTLPDLALLAVDINDATCWHWTVFARENNKCYILDSRADLEDHTRTDFEKIQVKWYIKICG